MILFFQAFISYTGDQSLSHVLLWQPSECVHLIVTIVLCCSRKLNMMMMMMSSPLNGPIMKQNEAYRAIFCTLKLLPVFGRPYYRSSLWYSISSVCRLSVCNVLYCGKTVRPSEKVSEGVNRKPGSKSSFFGSPPYFYFRFWLYSHRDGRFWLIFYL